VPQDTVTLRSRRRQPQLAAQAWCEESEAKVRVVREMAGTEREERCAYAAVRPAGEYGGGTAVYARRRHVAVWEVARLKASELIE